MLNLLNPGTWLAALGLAAAVFLGGYWKGSHDEKQNRAVLVAKADKAAFRQSEIRQRQVDDASQLAATRARDDRARAAGADRVIAGMRGTLDATERNAKTSLGACGATVTAYRAVFESCTAEYRAMGEEAAGHATDSLRLQMSWPK